MDTALPAARTSVSVFDKEWLRRGWPHALLVVLVLLTVGQFLQASLVSTDWWPVLSTNQVTSWSDFVRAFREPIGAGDPHFIRETARHYRPLATLSFALDYKLWGLQSMGWQLTNLLVHLGVTLGVYALGRTLQLPRWAATLAAAIFALHPVIVATEPAIARRHDTLSALFLMAALVLLLKGQRVLPAVLFTLSILSKEASLAAVPFVPLLLRAVGLPMTRAWVLLPSIGVALGLRILAVGDLGGYGTAALPSLEALPIYWDRFSKYFVDLLYPLPIRPAGRMAALAILLLLGIVGGAALTLPRKERYLALVGLAWIVGFAFFYAGLKVYAGSWYLYMPLVGVGLVVAALASGGWVRRQAAIARLPLGLAAVMTAGVVFASPLISPYPDWHTTSAIMNDYLQRVDTCTESGNPPLYPPNEDRRSVFVSPTGLLDYSVTAYIALRFPDGRPCDRAGA